MAGSRLIVAAASAGILLGMSGAVAHAAAAPARPSSGATFTDRDVFAPDLNSWGMQGSRKSLQWDPRKGRWGLKLDLEQSTVRPLTWTDVGAGAFYKITPSLRVGGSVTVPGAGQDFHSTAIPQDRAPRVKLETAFKF